jgi:hypothetical protein
MLKWTRKNIGAIAAFIGFTILTIMTFGDIAKILTEEYWHNVWKNITGISAISIGLVFVQYTIKQGISEQALSIGLNTENTMKMYALHNEIVKRNVDRSLYLPYFLDEYNRRETKRRRQQFLVDNHFKSEAQLYKSGNKKLIRLYNEIHTCIKESKIKWSSTEIVYKKDGNIETLPEYRARRARAGIVMAFFGLFGAALIATGISAESMATSIGSKLIQLGFYVLMIFATVIFDVGKNYEKGAFGIPNELETINGIWLEFERWTPPQWVIDEIERESKTPFGNEQGSDAAIIEEVKIDEQEETTVDAAADIQAECEEEPHIQEISAN